MPANEHTDHRRGGEHELPGIAGQRENGWRFSARAGQKTWPKAADTLLAQLPIDPDLARSATTVSSNGTTHHRIAGFGKAFVEATSMRGRQAPWCPSLARRARPTATAQDQGAAEQTEAVYSQTAIDHMRNPRNVGLIPNADGEAHHRCGDDAAPG